MNFKNQLTEDLDVFFNVAEFGEVHKIGNKDVIIIIDNEKLENDKAKTKDTAYLQMLNKASILFFAKKSDFEKLPKVNENIIFDGKPNKVININNINDGSVMIMLESILR